MTGPAFLVVPQCATRMGGDRRCGTGDHAAFMVLVAGGWRRVRLFERAPPLRARRPSSTVPGPASRLASLTMPSAAGPSPMPARNSTRKFRISGARTLRAAVPANARFLSIWRPLRFPRRVADARWSAAAGGIRAPFRKDSAGRVARAARGRARDRRQRDAGCVPRTVGDSRRSRDLGRTRPGGARRLDGSFYPRSRAHGRRIPERPARATMPRRSVPAARSTLTIQSAMTPRAVSRHTRSTRSVGARCRKRRSARPAIPRRPAADRSVGPRRATCVAALCEPTGGETPYPTAPLAIGG